MIFLVLAHGLNSNHMLFLLLRHVSFCTGEAGLVVTPLYGYFNYCFHWSLLLVFSLKFSSSSAFLRSPFAPPSLLSCGFPRFLQPPCYFVSDLFVNLPSFVLTMLVNSTLHPAVNYFANYASVRSNFSSQVFHPPPLHVSPQYCDYK